LPLLAAAPLLLLPLPVLVLAPAAPPADPLAEGGVLELLLPRRLALVLRAAAGWAG
jgi:hypothetical protein